MTTKPIGLYVHIPFCLRKCNYCDFCSFPVEQVSYREEYVNALCREIEQYRDRKLSVNSIFFGGGTPTLLSVFDMERVVSAIRNSFNVLSDTEFTVEANPGTVDEEKLVALKKLGVNRLSFGLQSIHENELKILGRIHNYEEFGEVYRLARKLGIDNINVDLMYGIPSQNQESFAKTLEEVCTLSPEHISLYGLILEEGTPLFKKREHLDFPSEDEECDMYYYATDFLRKKGYSHYEISNYSKPGLESRHNLKYWQCDEYIGVGLSAYSYFDGFRFGNTYDIDEYLRGNYIEYTSREPANIESLSYEFVMLGLRTATGISLAEYEKRFDRDFMLDRKDKISALIDRGYAEIADGRLYLTEKGFYVSNTILTELI